MSEEELRKGDGVLSERSREGSGCCCFSSCTASRLAKLSQRVLVDASEHRSGRSTGGGAAGGSYCDFLQVNVAGFVSDWRV